MVLAPTPPRTPVIVTTRPPCSASGRRDAVHDDRPEMPSHHVARNRLEQVFLHAKDARRMPIEIDVVELADQQHMHIGFDDIRQRFERGQWPRLRRSTSITSTRGVARLLQHLDGAADVGTMELDAARRRIAQPIAQHCSRSRHP